MYSSYKPPKSCFFWKNSYDTPTPPSAEFNVNGSSLGAFVWRCLAKGGRRGGTELKFPRRLWSLFSNPRVPYERYHQFVTQTERA